MVFDICMDLRHRLRLRLSPKPNDEEDLPIFARSFERELYDIKAISDLMIVCRLAVFLLQSCRRTYERSRWDLIR